MAKEHHAFAYLKPTGSWLGDANEYYADDPSFRAVDPSDTYRNWRLMSSATPGDTQTANIWAWTAKQCPLCDIDYVVVSADPYMVRQIGGEYFSGWCLGKVRIELAVDEQFQNGFFVEWETQKVAEYASLADTLVDTGYGTYAYGNDPAGSIFGDRTAWFNHNGSYAAEADVSQLCVSSFPSWVTQQASMYRFGIDAYSASGFASDSEWPVSLFRLADSTGQPVTFIGSVMRFGAIGETPQERFDYGLQMLRKRWGGVGLRDVCLSLGVYDNLCGASANDTFWTRQITGQEWLVKKRYARVLTQTSQNNEFLITGRPFTFQYAGHPRNFSPSFSSSSAVQVSATSPRVLEVNAYRLSDGSGVASPKTDVFAASTADPGELLYQPTHDPRDVAFVSKSENPAVSFTASRTRSAATLAQPSGQVRALQHGSFAHGKSLQVTAECIVGSVQPAFFNAGQTPNGDADALLPAVALLGNDNKIRNDPTGSIDSGWTEISLEEASRADRPNESDYMDGTYIPFPQFAGGAVNLLDRAEFEAFIADYETWIASPTGGGTQSLATEGTSAELSNQDAWQYVYAQKPSAPWFRHPPGSAVFSLQNNAGQAVYTASGLPAGPSYSPVKTLDLPYYRQSDLVELVGLSANQNTPVLGNLAPATYDASQLQSNTTASKSVINDGSQLKTTYNYELWPEYWAESADPWNGGTEIATSNWHGLYSISPTKPTWEALATAEPGRLFSAITSATYTPIRFDCVAFLDTYKEVPDAVITDAAAYSNVQVDKYDAGFPAVVPPAKPGQAAVVIHWRRTWRADVTVTAGPISVSGSHTTVSQGRLVDLADDYPQTRNYVLDPYRLSGINLFGSAPLSALTEAYADYSGEVNDVAYFGTNIESPPPDRIYKWDGTQWTPVDDVWQSSQVDVETISETVDLTWDAESGDSKEYSFLFHDQWVTAISITASEWQQLQDGQPVTVFLKDISHNSQGSNFYRGDEGQTDFYSSFAGFNPVESNLKPQAHAWAVEAQLKITLQFA